MRRGTTNRLRALLDNTLVVGLVALALVGVALAISYRAQNGLPWITSYRIEADVPDALKLLKNADVRIGGARVGQVLGIRAEPGRDGKPPFSRLDLALDPGVGPLPADSTLEVRLASVLGGKFLDLVPGTSEETIPEGGVLAVDNAIEGTDPDEALLVFGPQSRDAIRATVAELAHGLAGRGTAVNTTLEAAARLMPSAQRVLGVLADRETGLAGFVRGAADAAEAVAPLAERIGVAIDDTATTLGAIDDAGSALDDVLTALPPAEAATTTALQTVGPVLDDAAAITRSLAPAGEILEESLDRVSSVMRTAAPITRRVGGLASPLDEALRAVDGFSRNPAAIGAIEALKGEDLATFGGSAFIGLGAILRTVSDAQLNCNSAAIWMRNLASIGSEGDAGGNWLRMIPVFVESQTAHASTPAADLHVNYYPNENADECEAGNEPFGPGSAVGNPPGLQPKTVEITERTEGGP